MVVCFALRYDSEDTVIPRVSLALLSDWKKWWRLSGIVTDPFGTSGAVKPHWDQKIKGAKDLIDRTSQLNAHAELETRIKKMKASSTRVGQKEERLRSRENSTRYRVASGTITGEKKRGC